MKAVLAPLLVIANACSATDPHLDLEQGAAEAERVGALEQPAVACQNVTLAISSIAGIKITHQFYKKSYSRSTSYGERTFEIMLRQIRKSDQTFAYLFGPDEPLRPGDRIWVERSRNGTSGWEACPKMAITEAGGGLFSMSTYNVGWYVRPCFDYYVYAGYRNTVCGPKHLDDD